MDRNGCATSGKFERDGTPDAARGTGNEEDSFFKLKIQSSHLS